MQSDFTFDKDPKAIIDCEVKQLRNKQVPLVKVLWQHYGIEEATLEPESTMRAYYPQLFYAGINFDDEIILRGGGHGESCNTLNYTLLVYYSLVV